MAERTSDHWREYLMEAGGLGIFMISACLFTTVIEHPGSPIRQWIANALFRRILIGAAMGFTAIGLVYSPWGKQSGAHLNPSVTITFFRLGKVTLRDAFFYILAQFVGADVGVLVSAFFLRPWISHPAVNYAATVPGPKGASVAFVAELFISFVLMTTILFVSNGAKFAVFTGVLAGILVATYISLEAPLSGMSMNPARTLGSALSSQVWKGWWIYFTAPPIGMLAAAELHRRLRGVKGVVCAKLHHQNDKRCIFRCGYQQMTGPSLRAGVGQPQERGELLRGLNRMAQWEACVDKERKMTNLLKRLAGWVALSFVVTTGTSNAQVSEKKVLTLEGARKVIAAAEAYARQNNAPGGVIAVVDDGGNLMALERLDGTFAAGASISIGKARTAVMFKKPSKVFEDLINKGRTTMVALKDFTPLQGGIPIVVSGQIVGGVGVSGASSAQQDEELAIAGAQAASEFTTTSAMPAPATTRYFAKDRVDAAFDKGAVLFERPEDGNFAVHTSRRDSPGVVEVHQKDADIMYVLKGSATIVTGGKQLDGKTVASDEIRGTQLDGGEAHNLVPGDVLIIPHGEPHWFKEVKGPLLYFTVKVR